MTARKDLRVLNVEDSSADSALLELHLCEAGYDVVFERVDTDIGMKAALETREWDVILADYSLPQFSGLDALALLQQTCPDIPFIIISGTIGERLAVAAMKAGAADYLMKGELDRLASVIERELADAVLRRSMRQFEAELARLTDRVHQQRDRLNTIIASVPGLVWEAWDKPDAAMQRIDFASDYVEAMLGYSVQEWLSIPNFWLSIVHPDDKDQAGLEAAANFAANKSGTQEFRWIAKDGRILWVSSSYVVITDNTGQPVGMRGVTVDLTKRRQAETTLRENEERFRRYFELGLIGMAIASGKGFLEVNHEVCKILGYDRSELLEKTWEELTHPDDRIFDEGNFNRVIARECDGFFLSKRFIHKSGRVVYTMISMKCVRSADASVAYFVALIQDITESRLAQAALHDSEDRYRQLFEANPDPTFVFDQETLRLVAFNEAAVHEYGYSREELLSLTARDIRPPEEVSTWLERLSDMPNGPPQGTTWKHKRKDGTIIDVEITRRPMLFGGRKAWVTFAHNVTQRKILEEQHRQSQKMDAVGQLAGGIAHDFNNLLTVINGYSDLALGQLGAHDPLRHDLEEILRAGDQAAALTRQLLVFSRKQVLFPTILDLNTVVSDLQKMLRRLIGEDIVLSTDLAPGRCTIKVDRGQIEQVVMNLAINARDAMPSGGKLIIATQNLDLTPDNARHHGGMNPGAYVILSVRDTGVGMDVKIQDRIFEPFFTTKEAGKGTGLGLSTVYGIVRQFEGTIEFDSEIGHGTVFRIYWPHMGGDSQSRPQGDTLAGVVGGTETILLTEDDEKVRTLASRVLSKQGYSVLAAANGAAAISLFKQHKDSIHMLITDVIMPGMNGHELVDYIGIERPGLKILYMSGYTDKASIDRQVLDEKTPFIQKPFASRTFLGKVRDMLDR